MTKLECLGDLNDYFDVTEGAVIAKGGEFLRSIEDAVLAILPINKIENSTERASHAATEALCEVNSRLDATNARRESDAEASIVFGAGLHVGEVLYGNIGVPERVEFSVIGVATNEAARIEPLTNKLSRHVLANRAFVDLHPDLWHSVCLHALWGLGEGVELFAFGGDV